MIQVAPANGVAPCSAIAATASGRDAGVRTKRALCISLAFQRMSKIEFAGARVAVVEQATPGRVRSLNPCRSRSSLPPLALRNLRGGAGKLARPRTYCKIRKSRVRYQKNLCHCRPGRQANSRVLTCEEVLEATQHRAETAEQAIGALGERRRHLRVTCNRASVAYFFGGNIA